MIDHTGHFATTFPKWMHDLDMRLLWYCGLTIAELPRVTPALQTWYNGGKSAWLVANCLAAFIEGG